MRKVVCTFLACYMLFATILSAQHQRDDKQTLLQSGTVELAANLDAFITQPNILPTEIVNHNFYRLLQFHQIPNDAQLQQIKNQGIELLAYIPHKTYIASIPTNLNRNTLTTLNVRSVHPITAANKLYKTLHAAPYPDWAVDGDDIEVSFMYYENVNYNEVKNRLARRNITVVDHIAGARLVTVKRPQDKLFQLAALPFVMSVEPTEPPIIPDDRKGRAIHRSNLINTKIPGGLRYDGTGVNVLVRDDGTIGPHIDFKNRTDQSTATVSTTSNHGDGVAGIMSGAGNLDPTITGMAPGAFTYVVDYVANYASDNTLQLHQNNQVMITNSSYSNGCNDGYTNTAIVVDNQTWQNPSLLHVFSGGNSNNQNCDYGAGSQWGNVTGGHKIGKNAIATANLFADGTIVGSSSRGPATDGRLKPDISAHGQNQVSIDPFNAYSGFGGTSAAAPGIAGVSAQLYHAYKDLNGGQNPESALIKAALLNSADDQGNPGPDFTFGWGRVNAYRAFKILQDGTYFKDTISQSAINSHTITVPSGVKQIKVMTYWAEPAGTLLAAPALVNDIDIQLITPDGTAFQPWVLDPTPNATTLNADAVRGEDHLNNMEQVTLVDPAAGSYTLNVTSTAAPQGTHGYYVIIDYIYDEIMVTYPTGGEGFVPGEVERIYWDAFGEGGIFNIAYTTDDGANWFTIANLTGDNRWYDWVVPAEVSGQVRIRISRAGVMDESDANLSIAPLVQNIEATSICPDSMTLTWDVVNVATGYDVFALGHQYMDSIGTTTTNSFHFDITTLDDDSWFAVRPIGANGLRGRRTNAVNIDISVLKSCLLGNDLTLSAFISPSEYLSNCGGDTAFVTVEITNNSVVPQSNFTVSYQFDQGAIVTDTFTNTIAAGSNAQHTFGVPITPSLPIPYALDAWVTMSNDEYITNDTLKSNFLYSWNNVQQLPFTANFDNFGNCSVAITCEQVTCTLPANWSNPPNGVVDDIDWRTNNGNTNSNNTGPNNDHTQGNSTGKYMYLEASGGCNFQEAILITPCLDLTMASSPELSFWYHMSGSTMGDLHVDVFDGTQWVEDVMVPLRGNQGNSWQQRKISLLPFIGNVVNIRFRGITGPNFESDIAIDDINVQEVSSAPTTNFVASTNNTCIGQPVDFTDLSSSIPNNWSWTITPNTYTFVNGTTDSSQNPVIVFNATGQYDIELTTMNSNGSDTLLQSQYISVSDGAMTPLMEDFDGGVFPPTVVTINNPDQNVTWSSIAVNGIGGNTTTASYMNNFNYNSLGTEDAMTVLLDLSNMADATLTFDVAYAQTDLTLSDELRVDVSTDCGTTFTNGIYHKAGPILATRSLVNSAFFPNNANQWRRELVDLTPYVGNSVVLRFVNVNGFGNNLFLDNINIDNTANIPPKANFNPNAGSNCTDQIVTFYDNSVGSTGTTYSWDFGDGATPATSTSSGNQNVTYTTPGQKQVKLIVSNAVGVDSTTLQLNVNATVVAGFNINQLNDSTFQFQNTSAGPTSFNWDFGDGNTSSSFSPTHSYLISGTYTVTLVVTNTCGVDTLVQTIDAITNTERIEDELDIAVFPNPNNGQFNIVMNGVSKSLEYQLLDVQGRVLRNQQFKNVQNLNEPLDITNFAKGVYFLKVQTENRFRVLKVVVQ